jgi:hypothetical protein
VRSRHTHFKARLTTSVLNVVDRTAAAANTHVVVQKIEVCNNTSVAHRVSIGHGSLGTAGNAMARSVLVPGNSVYTKLGPITIENGADAVLQFQADANDVFDANVDVIIVTEAA